MRPMFTYLFLGLVALVLVVLIVAATRPDVFRLSRSATVAAPPERVYALVDDLWQFNRWNPYARKDPAMKTDYSGPDAGPGARFDFSGNKDVGRGSIAITGHEAPSRVEMELHMLAPLEGRNTIVFTLLPVAGGTQVTWAMEGKSPFIAKLAGLFLDMDRMIGKDFESGLANLQALAATSSTPVTPENASTPSR